VKTRIDAFDTEMETSYWPELSENSDARTSAHLAAAERIHSSLDSLNTARWSELSTAGRIFTA
jgi:hypothetical protein